MRSLTCVLEILKTGRPVQNSVFKVFNTLGIKFLTRLRLKT